MIIVLPRGPKLAGETKKREEKCKENVREYVWIIAFYEAEHGIKTAKMQCGADLGGSSEKIKKKLIRSNNAVQVGFEPKL